MVELILLQQIVHYLNNSQLTIVLRTTVYTDCVRIFLKLLFDPTKTKCLVGYSNEPEVFSPDIYLWC